MLRESGSDSTSVNIAPSGNGATVGISGQF
jgi:hypothetical protein